jgi:hypothetical protein
VNQQLFLPVFKFSNKKDIEEVSLNVQRVLGLKYQEQQIFEFETGLWSVVLLRYSVGVWNWNGVW